LLSPELDLESQEEVENDGSKDETQTEDITYLTNIRSKKLIGMLAKL
jgi:hypothetical protein